MTHVPGCPECTRITVALGPGQFERQSGPENDGSDPETGTDQTLEGSSVPRNRTHLYGSAEPTTPTGKRLAYDEEVWYEDAWVEAICAVEQEAVAAFREANPVLDEAKPSPSISQDGSDEPTTPTGKVLAAHAHNGWIWVTVEPLIAIEREAAEGAGWAEMVGAARSECMKATALAAQLAEALELHRRTPTGKLRECLPGCVGCAALAAYEEARK